MSDTLAVDVNPEGMHTLEVPERFETAGRFDIVLRNHGEATHVYLSLDDALAERARLPESNVYVKRADEAVIQVDVTGTGGGELTVATQYGSNSRTVVIDVGDGTPEKESVTVDETLAQPPGAGGSQVSTTDAGLSVVALVPVIGLALVAVVLAVAAALAAGATQLVLAGLAVAAAAIGAAYVIATTQ